MPAGFGVVRSFATIVMKGFDEANAVELRLGSGSVCDHLTCSVASESRSHAYERKMQRLQPELQALQKKQHRHPKKQQAIMKLYKDHDMNPPAH